MLPARIIVVTDDTTYSALQASILPFGSVWVQGLRESVVVPLSNVKEIRLDRRVDEFNGVLGLVRDFARENQKLVSGVLVSVSGDKLVAIVRSNGVSFDWDLSDALADLEVNVATKYPDAMKDMVAHVPPETFDQFIKPDTGHFVLNFDTWEWERR